ncbi:hypothetical protein Bbelb_365990 [Branchiostoma belcheri]|nr:hypothetical protein Bbelb_365990 [Branchiostoma belcheri]
MTNDCYKVFNLLLPGRGKPPTSKLVLTSLSFTRPCSPAVTNGSAPLAPAVARRDQTAPMSASSPEKISPISLVDCCFQVCKSVECGSAHTRLTLAVMTESSSRTCSGVNGTICLELPREDSRGQAVLLSGHSVCQPVKLLPDELITLALEAIR